MTEMLLMYGRLMGFENMITLVYILVFAVILILLYFLVVRPWTLTVLGLIASALLYGNMKAGQ